MRHRLALLALCAGFSLVAPAHSATITWTGAADQNWSNAANWDLARAPQSPDDVVLTGAGISRPLNLDLSGVTVHSLVMSGLGGLTISGNPLPLQSSGTITNNDPSNTNISFQVTLNGPATFNGPLSFLQSVAGVGNLTLNGAIALQGSNFYTGSMTINGTTDVSSGTLPIPNNSAVTVTGTLTSSVNTVVLASLSGSGTVNVSTVLTVGFDNSNTTFSGTYAGTGNFTKQGSGTLTLSGANTYTGSTTVGGGRLDVNGTIVSLAFVNTGATLGGTGTITGPVSLTTSGATLAPGNAGPGLLTVTNNLFMAPGNTLALKLNGTTQYDQVAVGGVASVGSTLAVTLNFAPTIGDVFTILNSTGGVSGTFAGMPDGSSFIVSGTGFRINYSANQVTLTVVAVPTITSVASAAATLGAAVSDTATIAAGSAPTGAVTFTLYDPSDATCAGVPVFTNTAPVSGNGAYPSAGFTPTATGVYRWIASYGGDINNAAVSGNCNDANESVSVNPALTLAPASLPGASLGSPYVHSVSASGGTPPYGTPTVAAGSAPPGTTFSAGTASINFTPAAATTFTFSLQVTDSGGGSAIQAYTIVVQSPSSATASAGTPQSATVNTSFATGLQVLVTTPASAPVQGAQVTFTAPGSGASGSFSGSNVVFTDATGHATAPAFTANTVAGSYQVITSIPGIASPPSFSLTNTPGVAANITATAGTPQSATVSTAFATALKALVRDAFNNPVAGASVTFAAPGAGASGAFAGGPTVVTNASGVATAPAFTANTTSGSYTVTASTGGVATPANFSLTNTPGVAASISATGGTPQSATVSTAFATLLQATVRDALANPVAGVSVTFAAPGSGASGAFTGSPTVTSNASGVATAPAFTANATAGSYTVTATAGGVATPANFSLTNTPGVAANISATAGTPQSATVSTAFATVLKATVRDALANPVAGVSVTFAAPGAGASGAFTGSPTVTTNASGVATAPAFTANATSGSYTVTATAVGVATPANFSLTNNAAAVTTFSGASPTGTGTISAGFTGGGAACTFTTSQFIPVTGNPASPPGPAPAAFPHGLFDFALGGCTAASTITMTITYPSALPAGTQYWKYGPTPGPVAAHWYVLPATITGNTVVFTITDGGLGDDDLLANGTIVDQGGPGNPGPPGSATAIPTLSQWVMALMALLLLGSGMLVQRRRR